MECNPIQSMSTAGTETGRSGSASASDSLSPVASGKAEEKKPSSGGAMADEKLLPSESQLRDSFNSLSLDPNPLNSRRSTCWPVTEELVGNEQLLPSQVKYLRNWDPKTKQFVGVGWDDIKVGDFINLDHLGLSDDDDDMI